MTPDQIDRIAAGPELDRLVTLWMASAMELRDRGVNREKEPTKPVVRVSEQPPAEDVKPYSTDKAAATWVMDRIKKLAPTAEYRISVPLHQVVYRTAGKELSLGRGETYPLAVCRAALKLSMLVD